MDHNLSLIQANNSGPFGIEELTAWETRKYISWTSNLSLSDKEDTKNTAQYDSKTAMINNTTNNDYQY